MRIKQKRKTDGTFLLYVVYGLYTANFPPKINACRNRQLAFIPYHIKIELPFGIDLVINGLPISKSFI